MVATKLVSFGRSLAFFSIMIGFRYEFIYVETARDNSKISLVLVKANPGFQTS